MPSIKELRERSKASKAIQDQKAARIEALVIDVAKSSALALTVANNDVEGDQKINAFATEVATAVSSAANDPVMEFEDCCRARGLKPTQIRKAVEFIIQTFDIDVDDDYNLRKEAVALYMRQNPSLYEDLTILK